MKLIYLITVCCTVALASVARAVCNEGCLSNDNTVLGDDALADLTTGTGNTAVGLQALMNDTTGTQNTAAGWRALVGNKTGDGNTAVGYFSLVSSTDGGANTALGAWALAYGHPGFYNTAVGEATMENSSGDNNTAVGWDALPFNESGSHNTVGGSEAMRNNSTGNNNTVLGASALTNNTTGDTNIAIGFSAGQSLTTGGNNIDIANTGVAGESKTIRVGTKNTHRATYIAGISGATVAGGVGVVIDPSGHLGTSTSSARYKDNIKPMDKASESILALQPVTFRYKHDLDAEGILQFGLVAEQVEKVNPDLVARDEQGRAYTVRYEAVNAMLLNEFLKEHRKELEQDATISQLKSALTKQQNDFQRQIETLTAHLKEQARQIQKVSEQLEVNKAVPRVVFNDR